MKKIQKQYCNHGHNTSICGRTKQGQCRQCVKDYDKRRRASSERKEYMKNYLKIYTPEWVEANPEKVKIISKRHEQKRRQTEERRKYMEEYLRKYYADNKEILDALNKKWAKEHPEVKKAMGLKCKTNRNLRIVAWTDWLEIKEVYKNCPEEQVVDHYIPLQGEKVSGLHVSWNLQYLVPLKNLQKWNRINVKEISEWYGELLKQEGLK